MTKRAVIVLMVAVNLALLSVLLLISYTPSPVFAQLARGGEFMMVSARAEQSNDAIYLLDLRTRQLHVFRTNYPREAGEPTRLTLRHSRDLIRDFGG